MLFSHNVSVLLPLCGLSSVQLLMAIGFYGICSVWDSVQDSDPWAEFQSDWITSADHSMLKLHGFNMWQCWRRKRCLKTGEQELVIEEINLSEKPSCRCLFLALASDWGDTKLEVLRGCVFLRETYELCLHLIYLAMCYPQVAIDSYGKSLWCDSVFN